MPMPWARAASQIACTAVTAEYSIISGMVWRKRLRDLLVWHRDVRRFRRA